MRLWGKRQPDLPFTKEEYELVVDLCLNFIKDPEFGQGIEEDDKQRIILNVFSETGVHTFEQLLAARESAQVEAQHAHEVAVAIARQCVTEVAARPALPETWLAEQSADAISQKVPVARLNMKFAVNRAERTLLEATCLTFITILIHETTTDNDPQNRVEAVAQVIGTIWLQWFVWNRPLAFAAQKGRDETPQ